MNSKVLRRDRWTSILCLFVLLVFWFYFMGDTYFLLPNKQERHATENSYSSRSSAKDDRKSSVYTERNEILHQACMKHPYQYGKLKNFKRKYLLYNKHNNFLFCFVQKIGCTFWKRIFLSLENVDISNITDLSVVHKLYLPDLHRFSDKDVTAISNSAFSVLFVRDPYSRLFSGYIDKFFYPNSNFWLTHGTRIIREYRRNPSNKSLECGHDVTFSEFIEYVVNSYSGKYNLLDDHFSPVYQHCRPCEIHYKIIGKMETFERDAFYVFNEIRTFNSKNFIAKWNFTEQLMQTIEDIRHFRNLDKTCLSDTDMYQRILKSFYYRGLLDYSLVLQRNVTKIIESLTVLNAEKYSKLLSNNLKKDEVRKHLVEHYKGLEKGLLNKVKEFLKPDCQLFGYDDSPNDIFDS